MMDFTVKFKKNEKELYIFITDSITYDVLNADETHIIYFPIYFLAKKYNFQNVFLIQLYSICFTILFSFTLPLDDGGYDYELRIKFLLWKF